MKRIGRELIRNDTFIDGVLNRSFEESKTIYQNKGQEVVHWVNGYRQIYREASGKAVLKIELKGIRAYSFNDVINRAKP